MIKERPIIFSTPMVRAILDGRKTQTRRVIKPQPEYNENEGFCWRGWATGIAFPGKRKDANFSDRCPYGTPGDRLWVRETFAETDTAEDSPVVAYKAGGSILIGRDHPNGNDFLLCGTESERDIDVEQWKPSIHMPRWAARILLEITSVRVERLQEIGENDALAEGIPWRGLDHETARGAFRELWDSINAKRGFGWGNNPWVWVIGFNSTAPCQI